MKETCIWQNKDEFWQEGGWQAGCHADCPEGAFYFDEDGPKENHFRFCPFCGKSLEVQIEAPDSEAA